MAGREIKGGRDGARMPPIMGESEVFNTPSGPPFLRTFALESNPAIGA